MVFSFKKKLSLLLKLYILQDLSLFIACQEKENQERNKDPGEFEGWSKYHLTLRYRQGPCGNFYWLFFFFFKIIVHRLRVSLYINAHFLIILLVTDPGSGV